MHGGGLLVTRSLLLHVRVHHLLLLLVSVLVLVVEAVRDFRRGIGVSGPFSEQITALVGSDCRA